MPAPFRLDLHLEPTPGRRKRRHTVILRRRPELKRKAHAGTEVGIADKAHPQGKGPQCACNQRPTAAPLNAKHTPALLRDYILSWQLSWHYRPKHTRKSPQHACNQDPNGRATAKVSDGPVPVFTVPLARKDTKQISVEASYYNQLTGLAIVVGLEANRKRPKPLLLQKPRERGCVQQKQSRGP